MAKQTSIEDQANTTAPGAEGTAETKEQEATLLVYQTPEWVAEVLESNRLVIESNELVLEALASFKEGASDFVKQLVNEFAPKRDGEMTITKTTDNVEFDHEANYLVAAGKEFRAPNDFATIHSEGDNVTHLGADRLQSLLAQGLVVALDQEES